MNCYHHINDLAAKLNRANAILLKISMFYFAKISRKNTKTFLKIYANVKNVNVIDNGVIYINKNGVFWQD